MGLRWVILFMGEPASHIPSLILAAILILIGGQLFIFGLAADTDGIDGVSPHAGVFMDPASIKRAIELGIDPLSCLDNNDALGVFEPLGQVITTGPTRTNVNDFRALLIL